MSKPLSVSDVVKQTGRARRTIQSALARGVLRGYQLSGGSGAWVINQADLDDYLRRHPKEG